MPNCTIKEQYDYTSIKLDYKIDLANVNFKYSIWINIHTYIFITNLKFAIVLSATGYRTRTYRAVAMTQSYLPPLSYPYKHISKRKPLGLHINKIIL